MTFDAYLTQTKGFHPAVSDFYTRYAVDALYDNARLHSPVCDREGRPLKSLSDRFAPCQAR